MFHVEQVIHRIVTLVDNYTARGITYPQVIVLYKTWKCGQQAFVVWTTSAKGGVAWRVFSASWVV
jgi:hypothetical protein